MDKVDIILLKIYKGFTYYKNQKNSNISINKNNIIEKIYFYIIINIITYKDVFSTGDKLLPFLYVKYYYEYNDFKKLIDEKENITKKLDIYKEDFLRQKERDEQNLQNEDLEETENEESTVLSYGYEIDKLLKNNLITFIPERYLGIYLEVIKKINYFYTIPFPLNSLVNYDNIQFTFNIIDLIIFNEKYMPIKDENKTEKNNNKEWIIKYKNNLKKLETDIFYFYKKSTLDYVITEKKEDNKNEKLVSYKIDENMKKVFNNLKNHLNNNLKKISFYNEYDIDYIPFGSITQFLNGKNGDIDLFLTIKRKSSVDIRKERINEDKTIILEKLRDILKSLDKNISFHQTNRLCLFTITYQNVKIDINVYGICSYYGEILLREYSLLDFRFPMLVIYLKNIIKVKNIKNTEKEKTYINSFAWTNILLTFLQDILEPPLFPRLLNEDNKKRITIKVGGGIGKEKRKKLEDEFTSQNTRQFNVFKYPDNKFNEIENRFYEIKNEKSKVSLKNQMPVSLILLKFIQFIGYFFNYKYMIVNTCYEYQSFMPKIKQKKVNDIFTKDFFKKCKEEEDLLLIREPFDHTYNPCKSVPHENLDYIKKVFREVYINILEKGEI